METTERAKRTKVRVVSMRPGSGPGPNLSGKRIILTNVTTARNGENCDESISRDNAKKVLRIR